MEKKVKNLFSKISKYSISSITKITQGYSNSTFKVISNNKSYRVRIAGNNDLIDRKNELQILKNMSFDYLYYEEETGNSVWEWIEGESVKKINKQLIDKLIPIIEKVHSTSCEGVLEHDDLEFFEKTKEYIDAKYLIKYKELVDIYKTDKRTLCHNDISKSNLLFNSVTNCLYLIDYEWGRINNPCWDYGNFIKDSDLSEDLIIYISNKTKISLFKLYDFIFISAIYSLQLSYVFKENTESLIAYRNRLLNQLIKYWTCLKK